MSRAGNVLTPALGALGVAALLAAGCSSDEAAPATTVVETDVVDTPPSPTSSATTVAATTTIAPTTTLDPAAALAAEVEADLLQAFQLGRAAEQDPFDRSKERAALDRRIGAIAENLSATLADYRLRNYAIRPNSETPSSVSVEESPVFVGQNSEIAEVQICEVNSWILVEVGAGPDGADAIVNPDIRASRALIFMREVDGHWRFEGSHLIEEWEGAGQCAP